MARSGVLLAQLAPLLCLDTIENVDVEKVRYHLSVRPFGCGLWLWATHDKIKAFAATYEPQGTDFSLERFWKDFEKSQQNCEN
jgi:hypothetical protein